MTARHPALVLVGAVVVFLGGLLYGFKLLTADADTTDDGPTCETRTVAVGEDLTSNLVAVDVLNASQRAGLANRVSINLQRRGFLAGTVSNSESQKVPRRVGILTRDPKDPRVQLVAQQFGGDSVVQYGEPDVPVSDNVVVIIGDGYRGLVKSDTTVKATSPVTVCVPIAKIP